MARSRSSRAHDVRDFLQLLTSGAGQGAVYGLIAMGFVTVYSVTGIVNLAQGQFAVIAAFLGITLNEAGVPLLAAMAVAVLSVALLAGLVETVAIRPARGASPVRYLVITLGVLLALQGLSLLLWGAQARGLAPITRGNVSLSSVTVPAQILWTMLFAVVTTVALQMYLSRTRTGTAFRAAAQQSTAARLVGVSPSRVFLQAFVLGGIVSAIGGLIVSPVQLTTWDGGLTLGLKGFVAASLAGLVSLPGALLGGVVLGIVESFGAGYISSGYKEAIAYMVLIVLLLARPEGIIRTANGLRV